jgi:hypothetical protein
MEQMTDIDYLMEGDPAIRWQTMRDLMDAPEDAWRRERERVAADGWGSRVLAEQLPDGNWPAGRWTGTIWTLLLLMELGVPPAGARFQGVVDNVAGRLAPRGQAVSREILTKRMDLCHLGFWLRIGAYFAPSDERLAEMAEIILGLQMDDGGWNCRARRVPETKHSSFHTTFNVLEGLRQAARSGCLDPAMFNRAEVRALEFMLQHKLYRSDKSGGVISERFLDLTYPSQWHYTVLRALDYIRETPAIHDPRLKDPLDYLISRRKTNGRWPVEKRIPGVVFFDMEPMGKDSRWNTLRALRVLRAARR